MEHKTKQMSQQENLKKLTATLGRKLSTLNVVDSGMFWED